MSGATSTWVDDDDDGGGDWEDDEDEEVDAPGPEGGDARGESVRAAEPPPRAGNRASSGARSSNPNLPSAAAGSSERPAERANRATDPARDYELMCDSVKGLPIKDGENLGIILKAEKVQNDWLFTYKTDTKEDSCNLDAVTPMLAAVLPQNIAEEKLTPFRTASIATPQPARVVRTSTTSTGLKPRRIDLPGAPPPPPAVAEAR